MLWFIVILLVIIACYAVETHRKVNKLLQTDFWRRPFEKGGMSLADVNQVRWALLHFLERSPIESYRDDDVLLDTLAKFLDIHLRDWEIEKHGNLTLRQYLQQHGRNAQHVVV